MESSARTTTVGWVVRVIVTAHAIAAFGQPVFAGDYFSGNIGALELHATGADVVFTLAVLQLAVTVVLGIRTRLWWPLIAAAALVVAESVQYAAGSAGTLWVHVPLGVAVVAALAVITAGVWIDRLARIPRFETSDA